ncbi:helix-turn-helix domain-containing protein [Phormidium tenue FACHB-886]|nr:helix-turn-helix domain-containing protein [Phormidium tenue FACHB-886]
MDSEKGYLTQFQRKLLSKQLDSDLRSEYRRRIEIMLLADAGKTQAQICTELRCSAETARYWIFMAQTGRAHLWNEQPIGRPKAANEKYQERLRELVHQGPRHHGYPFKRWTGQWLSKHLAKELGIEVTERHVNRLLREMGLSTRQSNYPTAQTDSYQFEATSIKIQDLQTAPSEDLWQLLQLTNNR